jgi:hypothetical protein
MTITYVNCSYEMLLLETTIAIKDQYQHVQQTVIRPHDNYLVT